MYTNLTDFEKALARFGDRVELIIGLEVGGKLDADEAYQQIKEMLKQLKKLRRDELRHGKDLDNLDY